MNHQKNFRIQFVYCIALAAIGIVGVWGMYTLTRPYRPTAYLAERYDQQGESFLGSEGDLEIIVGEVDDLIFEVELVSSNYTFYPVSDDVLVIDWPHAIFVTDALSQTTVISGPATVRFSNERSILTATLEPE